MSDIYEGIVPESPDDAKMYGTPRHSGRYPWGSGKNPQRSTNFYRRVGELREQYRKEGMSAAAAETLIAKGLGMSTTDYRKRLSNARAEERQRREGIVRKIYDENPGISKTEISRMTGLPEATVRSLLNEKRAANSRVNQETAEQLKAFVDKAKYVDIGTGSELALGCTASRLGNAVALLKEQGYQEGKIWVEQMGSDGHQRTSIKVLYSPDVDYQEVYNNRAKIRSLENIDRIQNTDGTWEPSPMEITPIDMKRVYIRYPSEGGAERDGTIELRRGVDDISIGKARYAQCRIAVDDEEGGPGKYFLKGVAVYRDDIPPGYDIVFNTSKPDGSDISKVLKPLKTEDPSNPFGASIKTADQLDATGLIQKYYTDKDGKTKVSPINVVNEEGSWQTWTKSLPSQMLSKQSTTLVEKQLTLAATQKAQEFAEIMSMTNPTVKKKMLETFSEECDAAAVDLKAAALPRQSTKLILPCNSLKPDECYAPTYPDGAKLALIRYPHQYTGEIPIVTVNNKNKEGRDLISNAPDAIGIHHLAAERLSGADFDGDTVTAIPLSDRVKIRSTKPLKELEGFDPKKAYPAYPGMQKVGPDGDGFRKGMEMGKSTNLLCDMTLKGAPDDEIARAVKYAQVVIDAEKHQLDWKGCYEDCGIAALKKKWQDNGDGHTGASTIISRAKSPVNDIPMRKARTGISKLNTDPETGEKIDRLEDESKRFYDEYAPVKLKGSNGRYLKDDNGDYIYKTDSNGKIVKEPTGKILERTSKSTRMAEAKDAYSLTSGGSRENPGNVKEALYAEYANTMKNMANQARKAYLDTPNLKRDPEAAKEYSAEVASLDGKLKEAQKNAPRERQAQLLANEIYKARKQANPDKDGDKEWAGKAKAQALSVAREQVGAKKKHISITEKEWEAIQHGAITDSKLRSILNNTKTEEVKKLAMPKASPSVSSAKQSTAKAMYASGYTQQEIADKLGISQASVSSLVK